MNKKVVLSVLSTAVVASMAASAFAAPKDGLYIGGSVNKYYSTDVLLNMNAAAKAAYANEVKSITDFNNLVFVDFSGKGASIQEILDEGLAAAKSEALVKEDFATSYAVATETGSTDGSYDARANVEGTTPGDLKVDSVSAINANEIKVVFGKEVNEDTATKAANYTLVDGTGTAITLTGTLTATLLDDKKTVLLSDVSGGTTQNPIFSTGDTYQVTVKDVLDKDYNKFAEFKTGTLVYTDTTAPSLLSAKLVGNNVNLYFSEPIVAPGVTVKVDGGATQAASTISNGDGEYVVSFVASTAQKAAGTHTVTVYGATDAEGNDLPVATASYTASADTVAPAVESISAKDSYTFKVKFSERLSAEPGTLVVKKGSLTLPLDPSFDETAPGAADGNGIKIDSVDSTGTTYLVKVKDLDATNKVYATGETSVSLNVKVANFKDNGNLLGAEYNGTVTLSKDATTPTVVNAALNTTSGTDTLVVKFDKSLNSAFGTAPDNDGVVNSKITVTKNGVVLPITDAVVAAAAADGSTKVVNIQLTSNLTPGTYSVKFGAGAVAAAATGNTNGELTTSVDFADTTTVATPAVTQPATNVIQVAFAGGIDMTDSATNLANYTLDGQALPAGTTIGFYGNKQTVRISLPTNYYAQNSSALFKVSKNIVDVQGHKALVSTNPDVERTATVTLTDNIKPVLESAKFFVSSTSATTASKVQLTFSEDLGTAPVADDLLITVNGNEITPTSFVLDGDVVTFAIPSTVIAQGAVIKVLPAADQDDLSMDAADVAGNKLTEGTTVNATEKVLDSGAIAQDAADVATDKSALNVGYGAGDSATNVTGDVTLAASGSNGTTITWSSDNTAINATTGVVTRPATGQPDATVTLTATITKGSATDTKSFTVTVIATP